jgi:hypothetical protein
MLLVFILNLICVFFSWLEGISVLKNGLKISIFIIFIFLSIRYDYGNDYMSYLDSFESLKNGFKDNFYFKSFEYGWLVLNIIFLPFGFFSMQIFLAGFSCTVLYYFIKQFVPAHYYWFSIFFYTMSPYQMLVFSSAMRQSVSIFIFLIALIFLVNKQKRKYVGLIIIAVLFHTSALFLLLFAFIPSNKRKINLLSLTLLIIIAILPILFNSLFIENISSWINSLSNEYESYTEYQTKEVRLGFGFYFSIIVYFIFIFKMIGTNTEKEYILFIVSIASFLLLPATFSIEMASRIIFYLNSANMVVYPILFTRLKNINFRILFIAINLVLIISQFYYFSISPIWKPYFNTYKTIFSIIF